MESDKQREQSRLSHSTHLPHNMLTRGDDALIAWRGNQYMLVAGWLAVLKDGEKGLDNW